MSPNPELRRRAPTRDQDRSPGAEANEWIETRTPVNPWGMGVQHEGVAVVPHHRFSLLAVSNRHEDPKLDHGIPSGSVRIHRPPVTT